MKLADIKKAVAAAGLQMTYIDRGCNSTWRLHKGNLGPDRANNVYGCLVAKEETPESLAREIAKVQAA